MKAIEEHLVEDTLVRRYEVERTQVDGLPGREGSFTPCSFWYVECLARAGELEKAQLLFEKLLVQKSWVPTGGILGISRRRLHISH
jgi:GH15 family glucan-1,4-alpha-glucosidase